MALVHYRFVHWLSSNKLEIKDRVHQLALPTDSRRFLLPGSQSVQPQSAPPKYGQREAASYLRHRRAKARLEGSSNHVCVGPAQSEGAYTGGPKLPVCRPNAKRRIWKKRGAFEVESRVRMLAIQGRRNLSMLQ